MDDRNTETENMLSNARGRVNGGETGGQMEAVCGVAVRL